METVAYVGVDYHQSLLALVVLLEGQTEPIERVKLPNDPNKFDLHFENWTV